MNYFFLFLLSLLALGMVFGGLFISRLIAPKNPTELKNSPYECGEQTIGTSSIQYHPGYYVVGLMFLIFDVEAAFLFPVALVLKSSGFIAVVELILFVFILTIGLVYAWKKGVLRWL